VSAPGTALAPRRDPASDGAIEPRRRYTWLELVRDVGTAERERLMMQGIAPRFEDLVGYEFAGANTLGLTRWVGIRKFIKGFYEGPPRVPKGPEPFVQGYNIGVLQNADDAPHIDKPSTESPKRFGFYRVYKVVPEARDNRYPGALLLDYGLGGNGIFGPPLRDYLVQVYPDDPDLLLGKAYLALGGLRIPLSFFVLKRLRRHTYRG
jgi:hypothetical protein